MGNEYLVNEYVKEITPKLVKDSCVIFQCPIIQGVGTDYIIIGSIIKQEELEKTGLVGRVGEGEIAIKVPRQLIDNLERKTE